MKIIVANTAGFCMGVRRAVEIALDAPAKHQKPICTFGPLIHNPQVLDMFAERGVTVLNRIPASGCGTVIVRAHGVPPETKQGLKQAGFTVIDATCPRVAKVQSIIKRHALKGYTTIIIGDENHPEVVSLMGFAGTQGHVVSSMEALAALPPFSQAIVVAQTTQDQTFYQLVRRWVAAHRQDYTVFDTICDSTEKRQEEVRHLARQVNAVVVVGGKQSGNTRRLAQIVAASGTPAFHVETEAELDVEALSNFRRIGITAGASTPNWMIKRVMRAIDQLSLKRARGLRILALRVQRLLLLTNVYVALGAGCLSYAAGLLRRSPVSGAAIGAAVLYVMSMHILNNLTGREEDRYNDPERERFYQRHKTILTAMALSAGGAGLLAAFRMGGSPFWTLLAMSLLGLCYNVRLIPGHWAPALKYRRIRDLPGSKTVLIALAWGVVAAGLPSQALGAGHPLSNLLAMAWVTMIVFCRTAFFDILDIQGDRIVGKETLPILLGIGRSLRLLKYTLAGTLVVLGVAGATGLFTGLAFLLIIGPAALWALILIYEHGTRFPGMQLELFVESLFILTGVLAFAYHLAQ
ncbi:MAG: 4-hydroxy-3-methylbut-2-enyl diphosphate reductase [Desulfatitalea sp.]|nr:4-hydroxy-3-methylbut-2-enyl diphosphate reductase [Desulfatitalea sp.]